QDCLPNRGSHLHVGLPQHPVQVLLKLLTVLVQPRGIKALQCLNDHSLQPLSLGNLPETLFSLLARLGKVGKGSLFPQPLNPLRRCLEVQPKRPFDRNLLVSELLVAEDLAVRVFLKIAVDSGDLIDMLLAELVPLLSQRPPHLLIKVNRVNELDLALPLRTLAVGQDPDVRCDARVVEKLVRQGNDCLQPVVLNDPAADLTLPGSSVTGEERRAVEDDGKPAPTVFRVHLRNHVLQEEQRPITDPGQTCPETARMPELLVLLPDRIRVLLPVDSERWIAEHVVEPLAWQAIVGEGVPELDVVRVLTLDHDVGETDRIGLGIDLLPEYLEPCPRIEFMEVLGGY